MAIDDQAYKDALRAIESGEIPEDLDLPDPEDYDDMGGIKSLDRRAPSIKMASETPEEEAELMLMMEEFQKQQELKKQLEKEKEKEEGKMASGYKYKLNDFELNRGVYESMGIKLYNLIDDPEAGSFQEDEVREMLYGGQYASGGRVNYATGTPESSEIEALLKSLKSKADPFIKEAVTLEALVEKFKGKDKIPKRQSRMEKDYPDSIKKKYNFMELVDSSNDALEEELLDRKYNAKNYPPSQRNMSMEELKRMFKKAEEDKLKRAKGGIAGVL